MVDEHKAIVCCLLATSSTMLPEKKKRKRKMWNKNRYLKRNISRNAHLLNELLETDDALVVSAVLRRKLWDSLSELRCSLYGKCLEKTLLRPALFPVRTAQFIQFLRQV
jgi:hypothetical protein